MRPSVGFLALLALVVLSNVAVAQVPLPLPVNDGGYVWYYSDWATGTYTYTYSPDSPGPASTQINAGYDWSHWVGPYGAYGAAGTYSSYVGTYSGYDVWRYYSSAMVVEFLVTGMSPVTQQYLYFNPYYSPTGNQGLGAQDVSTSWMLWWQHSPDGTLNTGDWHPAGSPGWPGFSPVTMVAPFKWDITPFLNFDVLDGSPFSSYTLTHQGGWTPGLLSPVNVAAIPEPGTFALFGLGLVGLCAGYRIRRRKRKAA